ncbi:MAG: hypothetical protein R6W91_01810 [Thermoplasmata archaeon]
MGKRNKRRRQREAEEAAADAEAMAEEEQQEDETVQCPTCNAAITPGLPACPQCGQEFLLEDEAEPAGTAEETEPAEEMAAPAEEDVPNGEQADQAAEPGLREMAEEEYPEGDGEESEDIARPPAIKKTMLLVGVMISTLGTFGIVGLRAGLIQTIFGYAASPAIGPQEQSALVASMIPLTLGLAIVLFWGIKNNPVYFEMKKASHTFEEITEDVEEKAIEPVEVAISEEPAQMENVLAELEDELGAIADGDFAWEPEPASQTEELHDTLAELEKELDFELVLLPEPEAGKTPDEEEPKIDGAELKSRLAEEMRVERCEAMLSAVIVLPDDKARLKSLIADGISVNNFMDEIKNAVDRRRKKEMDRAVTADEKASILEDELVAELTELEEDLDDDDEDSEENLEDEILKEIEDLEDL